MTKPVWSHVLALSAWTLKKLTGSVARKPETRLQISACKLNSSQQSFPFSFLTKQVTFHIESKQTPAESF